MNARTTVGRPLAVLAVALVAVACGGDDEEPAVSTTAAPSTTAEASTTAPPGSSAPPPGDECSAAALPREPEARDGLPSPVAQMRNDIVAAATACDFERLEELAAAGGSEFTFSFGDTGSAAAHWREAEDRGDAPLSALVTLLDMPHEIVDAGEVRQFVWPSAFAYDEWEAVPEDDAAALRELYGPEELDQFEQFGSYIGYRVGITAEGDWLFFVAGD